MKKTKAMPGIYGETKTTKTIRITPTAWKQLESMARILGAPSVSDMMEQIGRGLISPDQECAPLHTGEHCAV